MDTATRKRSRITIGEAFGYGPFGSFGRPRICYGRGHPIHPPSLQVMLTLFTSLWSAIRSNRAGEKGEHAKRIDLLVKNAAAWHHNIN